jgi:hypothetical protein
MRLLCISIHTFSICKIHHNYQLPIMSSTEELPKYSLHEDISIMPCGFAVWHRRVTNLLISIEVGFIVASFASLITIAIKHPPKTESEFYCSRLAVTTYLDHAWIFALVRLGPLIFRGTVWCVRRNNPNQAPITVDPIITWALDFGLFIVLSFLPPYLTGLCKA